MHAYDEIVVALRRRDDDISRDAADMLDHLWSQDRLLSKAQSQVEKLEHELAETKRPLDAQMARLNERVIELNEAHDSLRHALEVIAVGDSKDPQNDAADELVALGYWSAEALAAYRASLNDEDDTSPEDELNCAEEWLDHYAAQLNLEQTHFDCVGDYIVAVVEAALKKGKED